MENFTNVEQEVMGIEVVNPSKEKRSMFKQQAIERLGMTKQNLYGSLMTIDEYNTSKDIWVRFIESGYMVHTTWGNFLSGSVKNPYDLTVFAVGYLGVGKYRVKEGSKLTPQYQTWANMLRRCYSLQALDRNPTYKGVTVCESWLNFQVFAEWYDENFYEVDGERTECEKDILFKGNKIYSPETTVFAPHSINILFTKRDALRGDLPIGVRRTGKKFQARCNVGKGEQVCLGTYDTPEQAFQAYKTYKEQLIKETAETYKDAIPSNLYQAMINYEVEIDD